RPSASVVRNTTRGVTVMPTAEGPSPRSDPRWTAEGARRAGQVLDRLIARRRRRDGGDGETGATPA
ncbi:MAG TPA: hypothetical protein VFI47_20495, partial [Acidimicrobiales bacterium]|nr:hypothetical protein [Acidimicrobiales bacterium]